MVIRFLLRAMKRSGNCQSKHGMRKLSVIGGDGFSRGANPLNDTDGRQVEMVVDKMDFDPAVSHVNVLGDLAATQLKQSDDEREAKWSPDGKRIAFVTSMDEDPDRTRNTDVFVIEVPTAAQSAAKAVSSLALLKR